MQQKTPGNSKLLEFNTLLSRRDDDVRSFSSRAGEVVAALIAGEAYVRPRRVDTACRAFFVRGVPIFEEGALHEWIGICTDITKLNRLEEQLMSHACQFEALFEVTTGGLIVQHQQEINDLHHLFSKNCVYPKKSEVNQLQEYTMKNEQIRLLPVDQILLWRIIGEESPDQKTGDIQFDEREIQITLSNASRHDTGEQSTDATCIARDATKSDHLQEEEGCALATLQQANTHLEQVNRAQSDFISIVSHEFRTSLTSIQGFSELLRDGDFDDMDAKEYGTDINIEAQRLNRMITELLDLERMKSGKMRLAMDPLDLNNLLKEVIKRVQINTPHHSIVSILDKSLLTVMGNSDKLTQVVTNLLSNAIKYSPDGGEIVVKSQREKDWMHVSVQDFGIGIPTQELEAVFLPYNRVDLEKTRYIQGTGLGLPIVQKIIQMHKGHVWVESILEQGSVFHFTLPLSSSSIPVK